MFLEFRKIEEEQVFAKFENESAKQAFNETRKDHPNHTKVYENNQGERFFRFAICNRVVQDKNDRDVFLIDAKK